MRRPNPCGKRLQKGYPTTMVPAELLSGAQLILSIEGTVCNIKSENGITVSFRSRL